MRRVLSKIKFVLLVVVSKYLPLSEKIKLISKGVKKLNSITLSNNIVLYFYSDEDRMTFTDIFIYDPYKYMSYDDSILIDIGGHKGYYAVYALMNGAKKVISYEFEKSNLKVYKSMIHDYKLDKQITVVEKAMSSEIGTLTLNVYDTSWSHSIVDRSDKLPLIKQEIPTEPLEYAIKEFSGKRIIVKSNSEGAECLIFKNIPSEVNEMLIAYHPFAEQSQKDFIEMVEKNNFVAKIEKITKAHIYINFRRK